VLDDIA
jgi:hypothetical protein